MNTDIFTILAPLISYPFNKYSLSTWAMLPSLQFRTTPEHGAGSPSVSLESKASQDEVGACEWLKASVESI